MEPTVSLSRMDIRDETLDCDLQDSELASVVKLMVEEFDPYRHLCPRPVLTEQPDAKRA